MEKIEMEQILSRQDTLFVVPAWASGFEWDTLVFPMFGVTGSRPQIRKPKKLSGGNITIVQAHAQ